MVVAVFVAKEPVIIRSESDLVVCVLFFFFFSSFFFLGSFPFSVVFVFGYLFEDLICKNPSINDKWSFVPLSVVFVLGICLRIQYVKNRSECCVDVKICP